MANVKELKAHAYDLLATIQRLQHELQLVNQKIAEQEQNATRNDNNNTN